MGLFTTYKGLESEQNVKYKNLPFSNDPSFNSQPFIQVSPEGDGNKLTIVGNKSNSAFNDLNKAATGDNLQEAVVAKSILSVASLVSSLSTIPSKFSTLSSIATGAYRSITDVTRLSKFMTTPLGLEFIAKQELLSLMSVRTETSVTLNGGVYNPLTTLAQAGSSFAGGHILPISDTLQRYGPLAYSNGQANPNIYDDNRLVELHSQHISGSSPNPGNLYTYAGGPGSVFGIGVTNIKFSTQPDGITPVRTMGINYIFPEGGPNNPKQYQAQYDSSTPTTYEDSQSFTLAEHYKMGSPGKATYSPKGIRQKKSLYIPLDFVNARFIYSSNNEPQNENKNYNDLIRFKIGVLDVETEKTNYTHFRAIIDSFSDSYSSDWSSQTYMGRGEKLYKYNSFDRSINMSFTVAAQSQAEMAGMYQKLNYLASTVTPQYTDKGYMTGNITKLTVGNYVKDQHGKIDSISFEIPEESPWLISNPENAFNTVINELPFIIKVQMRYTVIHNFRPELVTDIYRNINGEDFPNFGSQRYITKKTYKPTGGDEAIQFVDDLPTVNVNEKFTQGNVVPSLYYSKPKTPPVNPLPPTNITPSEANLVPGLNPNNSSLISGGNTSNSAKSPSKKSPKYNIFKGLLKNSKNASVR